MSRSIRTPLARVRGLGSAKEGVHHYIVQRVTAIALIFLVPWFLLSLMQAVSGGYDGALAWLSQPINAVLVILTVGVALHHMRLGMQVVIEDYIAKPSTRAFLLIFNTFLAVALFASAAFSALSIAG